jgi:serine O-acetyltransferase
MRKIWIFVNLPRLLIALFFYWYNRKEMEEDLNVFLNYGTKRKLKTKIISMFSLMLFNKEYRNIFLLRQPLILKKIMGIIFNPLSSFYVVTSSQNIGKGLLVIHGFSTIINAKKIGDNFTIYQQCTIGHGKTGKPVIGNNVTMYAGAIVIGDITIGDNCIIGAGAVVNKSIPGNTICVGNGFRVL